VLAALVANLGIAVAKFVGFAITGATSMLAEAIHSVADSGNQGLLLLGGVRARRPATPEHPFGYGRERYFWSFVVALVLFSVGGLFAVYEGLQKLRHPHAIESVTVALGILAVAVVLEAFSLRTAYREADPLRSGASWWSFVRHSRLPELPVVLLEDLGALVGLILAFGGVALAALTGDAAWDAYGTVAIGLLLCAIAAFLAVEMKSMLIGESAKPSDIVLIRSTLESSPGIRRLIHLKTLHLGPEELLVAAKVELDPSLSFGEVVAAINGAEDRVRAALPAARVLYVEPDAFRVAETTG
jgi:cation diffusion facilitator family transporter